MKFILLSNFEESELADKICQSLESKGHKCFYNLRDCSNPLKPGFWKSCFQDKCVLIFNSITKQNNSFISTADAYSSKTKENAFVVFTEECQLPSSLVGEVQIISASDGLESIIYQILNPGEKPPVQDIQRLAEPIAAPAEKTASEEDEAECVEMTQKDECDMNPLNDESSVQNIVEEKNIDEDINESDKTDSAGDDHETTEDDSFVKSLYEPIFTTVPKGDEYEFKEAFCVPLFVVPFVRGETYSPVKDKLIAECRDASITIQRALRYYLGEGLPVDENRAFTIFCKALDEDKEDTKALYAVAMCLLNSIGTGANPDRAIQLLEKAVEQGHVPSMIELGSITYFMNLGSDEAKELFVKARKKGSLEASFMLGVIAENEDKLDDAFEYYSEAGEMGFALAQNALACMYNHGRGVEKDDAMALQWLDLACAQNNPIANLNKAINYMNELIVSHRERAFNKDKVNPFFSGMGDYMSAPIFYNLGIINRRKNASIEDTECWFNVSHRALYSLIIPYIKEFNRQFIIYEKKRKLQHAGEKVAGGILWVIKGLSNLGSEDS